MNAKSNPAKAIFLEAVEKHDPDQWSTFLDRACANEPELRCRVEMLLKAHQEVGTDLNRAVDEDPALSPVATIDDPIHERPGTMIGPYKLMEQIGEGGMGLVFVAEQQHPVRRKVALKVIKPGMDSRQVVARFEAERQALALMDHPNIAKVLDGGETASGRPYFVMELVKGVPITESCDQNQASIRERLELFLSVCQAVQHAHQKGIIHRDLKPSNVLVMSHDGTPVVKVIDFGVAKAIGQQLTDKTIYTHFAQMVGTPLYVSPEQAGQSSLDVDTRSDIYSLGVLLYELLTGTTPFDRERLRELSYDEIRRIIREEEPPKPSTRISTLGQAATTISTQRQSEPRQLSRLFRGELDWIVMKALEKDRNRRYESASTFAADVQRYLADAPVLACPPSAWYRFRKFALRNRTGLAVAGLVLFCIALLGGGGGWVVRDWAARQAKAANDLELALERAELLQEQGKRAEGLAAYDRAAMLAGEAPHDAARDERLATLKGRLDAAERDQQFLVDFAEIRLRVQSQVHVAEFRFSPEAGYPEIATALRRYGIVIGVTPAEHTASLVQARPEPVRQQLLAALDECLTLVPHEDTQGRQWLLATLNAADPDPWRLRVRQALVDRDWATLEPLARTADVMKGPASFLLIVARALPIQMKPTRLELFRKIQRAYPADLWANHAFADELRNNGQPGEAIRYYTAAIALLPDNPGIYVNRGIALKDAGELGAAIADYRHALALAPQVPKVHFNLAVALALNRQFQEAIVEYRAYFRGEAGDEVAHFDFGYALSHNGQQDEAITEFRQAISLKKDFPRARLALVQVLGMKGRLEQAVRELHEAIRFDPEEGEYHYWLGKALKDLGQLDDAIVAYRKAIRLTKAYPKSHRKLDPNHAITPYKWLSAEAHCDLGHILRQQGEVGDALQELRRGHELGSKSPGWPYPSAQWVRECERLVELDGKLPSFLAGKTTPTSAGERIKLAWLCSLKRLNGAAARFYEQAFAAEPKLADDLRAGHRYKAACAAALAGCGQGKDADNPDDEERDRRRRQALDWLRADLESKRLLLEKEANKAGPYLIGQMRHWLADPDFAGVRGPEALAKLPAAERQLWQHLWKDVAATLQQAQQKLKK